MEDILINEATLIAICDAIREKEGTSELIPVDDMASRITAIQGSGGELDEEYLILTRDCRYRFANGGWDWFIEKYGDRVTTYEVSNVERMFYYCGVEYIPFDINCGAMELNGIRLDEMFADCRDLKEVPKINNIIPVHASRVFYRAENLRRIPDNFTENWDWSQIDKANVSYNNYSTNLFDSCYSLRSFPRDLIQHVNKGVGYSGSYFQSGFSSCYALDELVDLPIPYTLTWTSNAFSSTFKNCSRLKRITFETNADGTPLVKNWKSQTIDLSTSTGWVQNSIINYVTDYNSGITADKKVDDEVSYQALKDDPDWFTMQIEYSRYNHDSAVETINSLPDTSAYLASAGGTNTIKFRGAAGSATDGGAINTLTEEEIAVATAKGWTVTFA